MLETLFLVPSEIELKLAKNLTIGENERLMVCGVGVVASAIRTMQLLQQYQPRRTVLFGIAGAYDGRAELGQVLDFSNVALWGVGAGEGHRHQSLQQMNLQALPKQLMSENELLSLNSQCADPTSGLLLTVTAASGSPVETEVKLARHTNALAEDMEGFAVAQACQLNHTKIQIVRGISNYAGDRDHSRWKISAAMENCVAYLNQAEGSS